MTEFVHARVQYRVARPYNGYMERRIGIYSGAFDPVHPGHIAFAQAALGLCGLAEVVCIPEQKPRGKAHVGDIGQRMALLERTVHAISGLRVMQLESEQFTVRQTLPELHGLFPGSHLTFLFGSDVVRTLHQWEGIDTLLNNAALAVGVRSTDQPDEITAVISQLAHQYRLSIPYTLITTPESHLSSSQFRNGTLDPSRLSPEIQAYLQARQQAPA